MKVFMALTTVSLYTFSLNAIEGSYSVDGFDPYDKQPYTGTVSITKDSNNVYQATWAGKSGNKSWNASGTGLVTNNQASFIYKNSEGDYGLQVYNIDGSHLEGPFVLLNKNLVGNEKLDKINNRS